MLRESVIQWQCKSGKDEKEAESSPSWNLLTTWEILPIYRAWFTNLLLILSIKSLNFRDKTSSSPYQGLIFREIKDLETTKFVDKYIFLRIFRLHVFIHNKLPICGKMAGWGNQNPRRTTLELVYGKTPGL